MQGVHGQVVAALRQRGVKKWWHRTFAEIQLSGSDLGRVDAVVVTGDGRRMCWLEVYECKATAADLRRDVAEQKAARYLIAGVRHAYFAVASTLASEACDTVDPRFGVVSVLPDGRLRTVRRAPVLSTEPPDAVVMHRLLCRDQDTAKVDPVQAREARIRAAAEHTEVADMALGLSKRVRDVLAGEQLIRTRLAAADDVLAAARRDAERVVAAARQANDGIPQLVYDLQELLQVAVAGVGRYRPDDARRRLSAAAQLARSHR